LYLTRIIPSRLVQVVQQMQQLLAAAIRELEIRAAFRVLHLARPPWCKQLAVILEIQRELLQTMVVHLDRELV
jgi:hypothetical protein